MTYEVTGKTTTSYFTSVVAPAGLSPVTSHKMLGAGAFQQLGAGLQARQYIEDGDTHFCQDNDRGYKSYNVAV